MFKRIKISPYILILLSFFVIILIGGTLLSLPISTVNNEGTRWIDGIFTATSAVCVTGLVVNDVSSVYNLFGKTLILILIQIGGLGVITLSSLIIILISKKISYGTKKLLQEDINAESTFNIQDFTKKVAITVFGIELLGAIFLFFEFIQKMPLKRAVYYSIFHAVSAFCNAGFALYSDNLISFQGSIIINLVIPLLIILGGIGFSVLLDVYRYARKQVNILSLTTKMSVTISLILIVLGTILTFIFEYSNPETIGNTSLIKKIVSSFFQSVTTRTAGFNTIPIVELRGVTALLYVFLMFIGASPGSTGGGIKTTTFGVILLGVINTLRSTTDIEVERRRISWDIFNKAIAMVFISLIYISIVLLFLMETEKDIPFISLLFELISAFGTVGLSRDLTPLLKDFSKLLLILTMFIGRVGPLTMTMAMTGRIIKKEKYRYQKDNILIG